MLVWHVYGAATHCGLFLLAAKPRCRSRDENELHFSTKLQLVQHPNIIVQVFRERAQWMRMQILYVLPILKFPMEIVKSKKFFHLNIFFRKPDLMFDLAQQQTGLD